MKNNRYSADVWKSFSRMLAVIAGVLLLCLSAGAVLNHYKVPWDRWISGGGGSNVIVADDVAGVVVPEDDGGVSQSDIRPVEWTGKQEAVISGSDVALMREPADSSGIVCLMNGGKRALLVAQSGDWYKLRYSCFTGWVPAGYVAVTGDRTEYAKGSLEEERAAHAQDAAAVSRIASDSDAAGALDRIAADFNAVGAQVAAIKNGEVVYVHSYGYANKKEGKPMTNDTKIRTASVSKVGIAMAAAAMAEQGIVDLDVDIKNYLGFDVRNPNFRNVELTLRMLLAHKSTLTVDISGKETYNSFVKKLNEKSSYHARWKPGNAWSYSNSGICLAGMTLEAASGVVLVDYIDKYFFEPMGVDASYHPAHISDPSLISELYENGKMCMSVAKQLDRPYSEQAGTNFRLYAGDLTISAKDLARFICVLADDGTYDGVYYMSPAKVGEIQETYIGQKNFDQCLTIRRKDDFICGRTLYYHTGHAYGTMAFVAYDDQTRDGIAVITTGAKDGSTKGIYTVCYRMAEYVFANLLK